MSKLDRHKEWLTITEAANYLSKKLGEDATEADIFRLALKRRLVVSVYFVNHASARLCSIVPVEKLPIVSIKSPIDEDFRDHPQGFYLENDLAIKWEEKEILSIVGVWDLMMFGGERIDIEDRLMQMIGGPEVELIDMDGTFVKRDDDTVAWLQERFDDKDLKEMRERKNQKSPPNKKDKPRTLKEIIKDEKSKKAEEYYPACCLPQDSILVVRMEVLKEFLEKELHLENLSHEVDCSSNKNTVAKSKQYENLTQQRDEFINETYAYLVEKAMALYRKGYGQQHNKRARDIFVAYEKGDYNREIEEQVGGLPRRDLSFGRLKADLREKMKLEGYKKHIFGIPQT